MSEREQLIRAAAVQFGADCRAGFGDPEQFTDRDLAWLLHCAAKLARECAPRGGITQHVLNDFWYHVGSDASKVHGGDRMTTYFKAVRPDGSSFTDKRFMWATEPGGLTRHPSPAVSPGESDATFYLSVSTAATDCTGFAWPCRLLEVEPISATWVPDSKGLPNKIAGSAFRTVRELGAHEVFGPQGAEVVAIIARAERITADEAKQFTGADWAAAWVAAGVAARTAARTAAGVAAGTAARTAAGVAAGAAARTAARTAAWDAVAGAAAGAAIAWVCRDIITAEQFQVLTAPWYAVIKDDVTA